MNKNKGFTLIELLVVIAIIGILASVVLASLSTSRDKAKDKAIISDLLSLRTEIQLYFTNIGSVGTYASACPSQPGTTNAFNNAKVITILSHIDSSLLGNPVSTGTTPFNGTYCAGSSSTWAVASFLKSTRTKAWCVDSSGKSKLITFAVAPATPITAIGGSAAAGYTCN